MLHGVYRPCAALAVADHIVDRPGGSPHEVCACFVVIRLLHGDGCIVDNGLEQRFTEAILQEAVSDEGEVGFQHMRHNVCRACGGLILGNTVGIFGVEDGHLGAGLFKCEADLVVGLQIGDNGVSIHLGTGSGQGEDSDHGQELGGLCLADDNIPCVAFIEGAEGNCLGAVQRAAAANCYDDIYAMLAAQCGAFIDGGVTGVGVDAGQFYPFNAVFTEHSGDGIVDAVLLDAAAAVGKQYLGAVCFDGLGQCCDLPLAEINFGADVVRKVDHICLL